MKTINRTWLKNRLDENLLVKANKEPVYDGDDWSRKFRESDTEWVRYVDVKDQYPYSMIYDKLYGQLQHHSTQGDYREKPYYKVSGDKDGIFHLSYKWSQSYQFKYDSVRKMRNDKLVKILDDSDEYMDPCDFFED